MQGEKGQTCRTGAFPDRGEGFNPALKPYGILNMSRGQAGRYLAADHGNINARHFVSLRVLFFFLNIYFLRFARTEFPSHMQNRLSLQMGGGQGLERGSLTPRTCNRILSHPGAVSPPFQGSAEQRPAARLACRSGGFWNKG